MSLTIRLTGTGGAQLVPVFGCDCRACRRARADDAHRRRPCSAAVKFNNAVTLLDAGLPDLLERWPAGSFQQFLLTHYHMDHVQGLFPCAGEWANLLRFTARPMNRAAMTCSGIRACWISAIPLSRS